MSVGSLLGRPAIYGALAGLATFGAYLLTVILTTPNLGPLVSVATTLRFMPYVVAAISSGIGLQVFLLKYSKQLGCPIRSRAHIGSGLSGSILSSFVSFFSLVQVGCCGFWIYVLTLLPGIIGAGIGFALIEYGPYFMVLGLAIIYATNIRLVLRIRSTKRLSQS